MQQHKFRGTGVALITPFNNYDVDYLALKNIIDFVIEGGVDYIVSLGTTGEAITLSSQECRQVFDFTIKTVDNRVPIVAGLFGHNFTEKLAKGIKAYNLDGFDAIMSSSPAYNKPPQEGIYQHYMRIAEASPIPIIIYNVPGRTSSNVHAETTLRLAESSQKFMAVKEASGDLVQASQIIKYRPDHFLVLSGDDPLAVPLISCGGDGVISVIANLFPNRFSTMIRAALDGNFDLASQIHLDLLDVHPWLYKEGNPIGIKAAMEIIGKCTKEVRIPLVPLSDASFNSLKQEIGKLFVK